ncbi:MAG: alpha/beta fold hydrolase [Steroidobacteraceae bacterium]|nr:alpha/beta fold hydrolase [Steroidobacteraceae bacterium]
MTIRSLVLALAALLLSAPAVAQSGAEVSVLRRTTLIVGDAETSMRFYRDIIGMSVYLENKGRVTASSLPSLAQPGDASRFVIMKGKHPWIGMIGLLQYGQAAPVSDVNARLKPGDTVLMIETDDVEGIHRRMLAAGTPIHKGPETTEVTGAGGAKWTATFLFARDPDGHMIEINQRRGATAAGEGGVSVRREFRDSRLGQVHLRKAAPLTGAAQGARTPVVLLHQTPLSGRMFASLLPLLGTDRSVYALDTPGYGESAMPATRPTLEQYAQALGDVLESFGEPVDLVGYHTGAGLAVELARLYPARVRRLVLIAMPLLTDEQRQRFATMEGQAIREDGSHLTEMWKASMGVKPAGQSIEQVAALVGEKQRPYDRSEWALKSLAEVDLSPHIAALTQPVTFVRPKDGLWEHTARAAALKPGSRLVSREDWVYGLFDADPAGVAAVLRDSLDN